MKILNRKSRFEVELLLADSPCRANHPDRVGLFLTRLFRGEFMAENATFAAAQAWSDHVGKHFKRHLVQLDAPFGVANQQTDRTVISRQLASCSMCGGDWGFVLDNGHDTWFISVRIVLQHNSGSELLPKRPFSD